MNRCLVLLLLASLAAASPFMRRPHYLECSHSSDCGTHECCVFKGNGMYSIPRCELFVGNWGKCNPRQSSRGTNRSVTYPDERVVEFINVFDDVCPCETGLQCDSALRTCFDPYLMEDFNYLAMK